MPSSYDIVIACGIFGTHGIGVTVEVSPSCCVISYKATHGTVVYEGLVRQCIPVLTSPPAALSRLLRGSYLHPQGCSLLMNPPDHSLLHSCCSNLAKLWVFNYRHPSQSTMASHRFIMPNSSECRKSPRRSYGHHESLPRT